MTTGGFILELQTFYKDWILLSYIADDSHMKLYVQSKQTYNCQQRIKIPFFQRNKIPDYQRFMTAG